MMWLFLIFTILTWHLKKFMVCLFGGKIGWMEKFGEKMEMKAFL